jgi:hypothetical protein
VRVRRWSADRQRRNEAATAWIAQRWLRFATSLRRGCSDGTLSERFERGDAIGAAKHIERWHIPLDSDRSEVAKSA